MAEMDAKKLQPDDGQGRGCSIELDRHFPLAGVADAVDASGTQDALLLADIEARLTNEVRGLIAALTEFGGSAQLMVIKPLLRPLVGKSDSPQKMSPCAPAAMVTDLLEYSLVPVNQAVTALQVRVTLAADSLPK